MKDTPRISSRVEYFYASTERFEKAHVETGTEFYGLDDGTDINIL